jgi:hypothetical protein
MKLFTREVLAAFKKQGYQGDKDAKDIKIICKIFNPYGAGTWLLYEFNEEEDIFFGFANIGDPDCAELGAISKTELEEYRNKMGLGLERDLYFPVGQISLQEVIDKKGVL